MTKYIVSCIVASFAFSLAAQNEFTHPNLLSFEEGQTVFSPGKASTLSISDQHYKHGKNSLQWSWNASGASIRAKMPIFWAPDPKDAPDPSTYTFVYWIYNTKADPKGSLRFSFLKEGQACSWFEYKMNFVGWRAAWVAFERDMQGKPQPGMDEVTIVAQNCDSGTLFFDLMIPSSLQDIRQHSADTQAPFINASTTSHWQVNEKCTHYQFDLLLDDVTKADAEDLAKIEKRYGQFYSDDRKVQSVEELGKEFQKFEIVKNSDGTLRGKSLFFTRWGETYFSLGHPRSTRLFSQTVADLDAVNLLLFQMAIAYNSSTNDSDKREIRRMYMLLTRYIFDQGVVYGAAMGTIHHLGYSMKYFYPALFLMKSELYAEGLGEQAQQAMDWFSNAAEVKIKPQELGMDIDIFNTTLMGRLGAILMLQDSPVKVTYLKSYTRWLNNGFAASPGLGATFKIDGSVFHHRNNYPAYARDGMRGGVEGVYVLSGTRFAASPEAHQRLKKALLTMRFYCNLINWPLSMSGRHPKGGESLAPHQLGLLALAGSPDRKQPIDCELAAAYMRLTQNASNKYTDAFVAAGIQAEDSPTGAQALPYASVLTQRRENWAATVRGHSRYLWASETYEGANLYGRYLAHGNLQIVAGGNPVSNAGSGYEQQGWDWNYWWGTTATVLPISQLRSNVLNVDVFSGNEEMLYSDEAFAGPLSIEGSNGLYAFKLHEHDKYNGSLRAHKSYFFFDNRIVCLGSGVASKVADHPTVTTLFQEFIPQKGCSIVVDGKIVTDFPYTWSKKGNASLTDAQGNSYFVRKGDLFVRRSHQHSFDQSNGKPTENDFTVAAISHGNAPTDGSYEYAIAVQSKQKPEYTVLQQDNRAHIVRDVKSNMIGYALFQAGKVLKNDFIEQVSIPSLVMVAPKSATDLVLSLADPDLRFYEGSSDDAFDAAGKRIERSIYGRPWIDNESKISLPRLTLKGEWTLANTSPYCRVVSADRQSTVLEFTCQHGLSREVHLVKR